VVSKKVSVVQNVLMREHETLVVITSVRCVAYLCSM